jgi:hypothetical protein
MTVFQPIIGRAVPTYRVLAGGFVFVGTVRLDDADQRWVARTLGSERSAACLRRFETKEQAASWLAEREQAPSARRSAPEGVLRAMEDDPAPLVRLRRCGVGSAGMSALHAIGTGALVALILAVTAGAVFVLLVLLVGPHP